MGKTLSKCTCTSAPEQQHPLEALHPSNVDLSLAPSEEENAVRESEAGEEEQANKGPIPVKTSYQLFLLETLNTFRHESLFTDFTIKVNGKDFPVHRNVLAASSCYFRELFSNNDSSQAVYHEFEKVEPSTMENMLNILYTGK